MEKKEIVPKNPFSPLAGFIIDVFNEKIAGKEKKADSGDGLSNVEAHARASGEEEEAP